MTSPRLGLSPHKESARVAELAALLIGEAGAPQCFAKSRPAAVICMMDGPSSAWVGAERAWQVRRSGEVCGRGLVGAIQAWRHKRGADRPRHVSLCEATMAFLRAKANRSRAEATASRATGPAAGDWLSRSLYPAGNWRTGPDDKAG